MSPLNIRRTVVAVASVATGFIATLLIFAILGTSFEEFGIEWIIVTVTVGAAAMIWLDAFLGTNILPD